MQFLKTSIIALIIFLGFITFIQAESSWITKKKDKNEKGTIASWIKDKDKETITGWIKKKTKQNKKEYKDKDKNISKEIKTYIKKKSIQKYLKEQDLPPDSDFYFVTLNEETNEMVYGFINSKKTSYFKDTQFYKNAEGYGFIDDGETVCKIASEIKSINENKIRGEIAANCGRLKFNGNFEQHTFKNEGKGELKSKNGQVIKLNFYTDYKLALINFIKTKSSYASLGPRQGAEKNNDDNNLENLKVHGKYYALLIGMSDYDNEGGWDDLTTPKNDILELEKVLEENYKFEKIITAIDATRDEFFDKLDELKKLTEDKDYVLIYYSGHGEKKEEQVFWIPTNGKKNNRRNWINFKDVSLYFEGEEPDIPSTHLAFLVDSCWFNVKGSKTNDNSPTNYNKLLTKRAAVVLSSGSDEYVEEPYTKHSQFGDEIIKTLKNNDKPTTLYTLYRNVRARLEDDRQSPRYIEQRSWNHQYGDFIFIPKKLIK